MGSNQIPRITEGSYKNLDDLIAQINDGRCCAFIGAGLSKDAGYPLAGELIADMKTIADEDLAEEVDLGKMNFPEQVEVLRSRLGEERYKQFLLQKLGPERKRKYAPVHHEIITIPFLSWITTNFDFCLENAAVAALKPVTVDFFPELEFSGIKEHRVFHIHGMLDPNDIEKYYASIILSARDYTRAYAPQFGLTVFLRELFQSFPLVFIGYSLSDTELTDVIHNTQLALKLRGEYELLTGIGRRIQPKQFIILHQEAATKIETVNSLGLLPIYYEGDISCHSELQQLLEFVRTKTARVVYPEPTINRTMFEDGSNG